MNRKKAVTLVLMRRFKAWVIKTLPKTGTILKQFGEFFRLYMIVPILAFTGGLAFIEYHSDLSGYTPVVPALLGLLTSIGVPVLWLIGMLTVQDTMESESFKEEVQELQDSV